jgi:hypothetical protein
MSEAAGTPGVLNLLWGLQIRWSAVQLNKKKPDTTTFTRQQKEVIKV